ncbi:MAG: amidohydrolase family protein [Acidobacteria bacterium]|nr:amidohydrolase family protein [Acidobacteriota bacterium]
MRALYLAAALAAALHAETFLLRNVTVHPVSDPDIPNAAILVRDGRIADVGTRLAAPKGIRVIDGKGQHVFPGMINSATMIGLSEVGAVSAGNDVGEAGDFNPQLRPLIAVNPDSEHIPVTRANGITSVVTLPVSLTGTSGGGIIPGHASLLRLDGWTWEEMEINRAAAMVLQFPEVRLSINTPGELRPVRIPFLEARRTYESRLRDLTTFFENARRYQRARTAGDAQLRTDIRLEAMLPVLEGKVPVLLLAGNERAIREALAFGGREKLKVILGGVRDPGAAMAAIKAAGVPVILREPTDLPGREDDPYDHNYSLPARLHKEGIRFALGSFNNQFARNIGFQAAFAAAYGLPPQEALRSVTLSPATIWGQDDSLGSIEKGKWADLVLADGDILEPRTNVTQVFIHGRETGVESKHTRLYRRYLARP